ncbi:MAG: glutamate--cysteine ligase [Microbacteriaceae bacterium]
MRTVGVEEEFLLVDPGTGAPSAAAVALTELAAEDEDAPLQFELQQEMIETATRPFRRIDELHAAIAHGRRRVDDAARAGGARAVALGTSPLAWTTHTAPRPRYGEMLRRYRRVTARTLTCGMHVHVAIDSRAEGVAVLDRIRVWLPVLVALTANSPFEGGEDTGLQSFRRIAWGAWPSSGPLEVLGDIATLDRLERDALGTGVLLDRGMFYFDARLSRSQPTVEVRVADVCLASADAAVIAAVVRGLVDVAATDAASGRPAPAVPALALRLASWQAATEGLRSVLVHPLTGAPAPAAEVVGALGEAVAAALARSGDEELVTRGLAEILARGSGADWQRARFVETASLREVVLAAADQTRSEDAPRR